MTGQQRRKASTNVRLTVFAAIGVNAVVVLAVKAAWLIKEYLTTQRDYYRREADACNTDHVHTPRQAEESTR